MTRVLHVSQATGDGLDRYLSDVLSDQARRGWTVTLACPPHAALEAVCERLGARYEPWMAQRRPGPSVARETRALSGIIDRCDPEVVHLHSSKAGLVGRLAVRARCPTIFTPHAWSFLHGGPVTRRLALAWERWAARWTTTALCVSESERERGEQSGVRARYRVVPNAVDLAKFTPASPGERVDLRRRLELGTGPIAVCIGRFAPQKGQDVAVAAWPAVRARVPNATLVLLGDGNDREALERRAGPGIRFVGRHDEVRDWIVAGDLVVQPSRWEGMSFVTLEAMACGCSLVVTDVDGMRDALGDEPLSTGAIVPVDDPAALADAVATRLADPELAEREGACGRERAARFDVSAWGDAVAGVTLEALGG
jgi:glycosyltransferase involved in cell wall biosynthesis